MATPAGRTSKIIIELAQIGSPRLAMGGVPLSVWSSLEPEQCLFRNRLHLVSGYLPKTTSALRPCVNDRHVHLHGGEPCGHWWREVLEISINDRLAPISADRK